MKPSDPDEQGRVACVCSSAFTRGKVLKANPVDNLGTGR
jgi:hypothetical protein